MTDTSFEFINPRYLAGISDEPKQLLQPISGYAREPLLSLEEACEPLIPIVPRLQAHIWVAKQNSKNPADGLTQDESAAIRLYTMEWDAGADEPRSSLYSHLNRTLKLIDRTKLRPWFRYLKLFLTALAKLPSAPRQTVWRGVRKDHTADYPPGEDATWWSFSSCTSSLNVLESDLYLGSVGTRTLFSIETMNGRTIRAHSHFQVEDEILLLPGTFFDIKSRLNPAPDLYIIHLSQKRPPYDLLEPPFEGAELLPPIEPRRDTRTSMETSLIPVKDADRPWYKKNIVRVGIVAIILSIVLGIILGAVLGTRSKTQSSASIITANSSVNSNLNGLIPTPVSVANAFYAFDGNTLDLYSSRNGEVIGGPVSYVLGYVGYGEAIVLSQSVATQIQIIPGFNSSSVNSFTIEGFFQLKKTQLNATLVQLTPNITMNIVNGILYMSLGSNINIIGTSVLSTDQWHQFSFVYDRTQQVATIYIDSIIEATRSSVQPAINNNNMASSIIVGAGFQGYIDQLSINLTAKSPAVIQWDATVAAYYPLDVAWTLDKGPNGLNATSSDIIPIYGWRYDALNFNLSDSMFQASGFTALGIPGTPFSIALWLRVELQAGIFLTVSNEYTCILALGLQNQTNLLIAYLPNATSAGIDATVFGPLMPSFAWTHVAFTWSSNNYAQLYTSGFFQNSTTTGPTLSNGHAGNGNLPMTITLGHSNNTGNCEGNPGTDLSHGFMGSIDEVYVFTRELQLSEIKGLTIVYPT